MPVRRDDLLPHFQPLLELRRLNHKPIRYVVAVACVGVAALVRWSLGELPSGVLFITFYPAIMVATFVGGFGPGLASVVLSALTANYFFMPPYFSLSLTLADVTALVIFVVIALINVALISLLNETVDHLSRQEENKRLILESSPAGMIAVDGKGIITLVNGTAEKLFGYGHDELLGKNIDMLVPERLRVEHATWRDTYMAIPTPRPMGAGRDLFARQKDGAELPVEIGLNPIIRESRTGALATVVDISQRKEAQRKQEVLVHEVQHRAKNLLALVQAIASRTFIADERRRSFEAKIQALARTQDLFFSTGKATLADIVRGELVGFPEQVTIDGVDISLTPAAAQNFTLIVHELTTNALKYGALSVPSGKIVVQWHKNGDRLGFDWSEHGGPLVAVPSRKGFGQIILNDLAEGFGAKVVSDYAGIGFRYALTAALVGIAEVVSPLTQATSAA